MFRNESELNKYAVKDYANNSIWKLVKTSVSFIQSGSRLFFESQNDDYVFSLTLKRQPNYYMINFVFPCFVLNFVNLFLFFMPFPSQSTISMNTDFL
jgi:hypothetical protein